MEDECAVGTLWSDLVEEIKNTEPEEKVVEVKSLTEKINEVSVPMFRHGS